MRFIKKVLSIDCTRVLSDIILIVGYTETEIIIMTKWSVDPINIPNCFISNIKEMWNINVESPEELYVEFILNGN